MSAGKFVLKHPQIQVGYSVGITPGLVALTYRDGPAVNMQGAAQTVIVPL